jgi:hypothetical protein
MKNRYLSALMLCALMLFGALAKAQVAPANDVCSAATAITASTDSSCNPMLYSLAGATQESAPNACQGNAASLTAKDVWFKFNATNAQQIIDVNSQSMPLSVELYSTCGGSVIACGAPRIFPFFGALPGQTLVTAGGLTMGNQYLVRVYYYGDTIPAQANFSVCIHAPAPAPANDICSTAKTLTVGTSCNPSNESLSGANQESLPDSCSGAAKSPAAHDVWYKFIAGASNQVIEVNSQSMGMVAVLYASCGGSSIACANPRVFQGFGARPGLSRIDASGLTAGNTYYLRVYNYAATVPTQANFTVCVYTPPPAPANDLCSGAQSLTVGTTCNSIAGTLESATASTPVDSCQGRASAKVEDVWYSFVATKANETIEVSSTTLNPVVVLYTACNGTAINCANSIGGGAGAPRTATLKATGLTVGTTYFLRVYHYYNQFGGTNLPANPTFNICVFETPPPPANDLCSNATALTVGTTCNSVLGTLQSANQETPADSCNGRKSAKAEDVWYKFNATTPNQTIEVNTTDFTPIFMLYTACNGQVIGCANGIAGVAGAPALAKYSATGLTAGNTYYVRVYYMTNNPNAVTPNTPLFNICVYQSPPAPVNDDCTNATLLTVGTSCNPTQGTLQSATQSMAADACQGASSLKAEDVWYKFVATNARQTVEINSQVLFAVGILSSSCGGSVIACGNPTAAAPGTPRSTSIRATGLTVGNTYYVRVYNYVNNPNAQMPNNPTFGICVYTTPPAPANDECTGAIAITPVAKNVPCSSTITVNTVNASQSTFHASCAPYTSDDDVWYRFVANDTSMTIQASNFTGGIRRFGAALFTDCAGTEVPFNCFPQSRPDSTITFTQLTKGTTYYLEVFSSSPTITGTFDICLHGNSVVGIGEISVLANSLSVNPNPTSNMLNIHFDADNKPFIVKVQNINGQEIFKDIHSSPENSYSRSLDMSEFANGIYFLQIVTDKEVVTKKIVKQ